MTAPSARTSVRCNFFVFVFVLFFIFSAPLDKVALFYDSSQLHFLLSAPFPIAWDRYRAKTIAYWAGAKGLKLHDFVFMFGYGHRVSFTATSSTATGWFNGGAALVPRWIMATFLPSQFPQGKHLMSAYGTLEHVGKTTFGQDRFAT